ncbi:hypothetical protein E2562_033596 [Oryza meyeriana var. granulata]|uniref:Uncharacterized protein n=1 Tax=Oryza meyeriana var. granulata TaxID=110450 RepID=A0A6G1DA24_9ORYZ|nr:hypothetical protein E2562_033596 [Oryza meyeriana var. granulata]
MLQHQLRGRVRLAGDGSCALHLSRFDLLAASSGRFWAAQPVCEHEHAREAVGHRRLGGRDCGLLGVDERGHPLGEPEAGLLPAAVVEEVVAGRVLAEPVGGAAEEVERLEAGLEEADGRGAGREAEQEVLDLVVHDPAVVAPERGLQRRVLRGGPPRHAAVYRRQRRLQEGE